MYEYYLWNIQPNRHQTKAEFIMQVVSHLIIKGEVLIVESTDNQLFVADSFSKNEKALYDSTFDGVTIRDFTFQKSFNESDVIYLKYGNVVLNGLLNDMCKSLENLMNLAEKRYKKANEHKGILNIDSNATNTTKFQEQFEDLMNNRFKTFFNSDKAVLPLYEGYNYTEVSSNPSKSTNSEINDIQKLRSEAFTSIGNALHIPPALLEGNASQLSDSENTFISNAIDPFAKIMQQGITAKKYGQAEFVKGNYLLIDTTYCKHIDAISSANSIDKAIACGVISVEQAQKYAGMLPNNEDWAKAHYLTKNYQTMEMVQKGGEN